jgi:hypothetical protein
VLPGAFAKGTESALVGGVAGLVSFDAVIHGEAAEGS